MYSVQIHYEKLYETQINDVIELMLWHRFKLHEKHTEYSNEKEFAHQIICIRIMLAIFLLLVDWFSEPVCGNWLWAKSVCMIHCGVICQVSMPEIAFSGNVFVKWFSSIAIYLCWLENNSIIWWWRWRWWYNCALIHTKPTFHLEDIGKMNANIEEWVNRRNIAVSRALYQW